jgi:hypothetical protein
MKKRASFDYVCMYKKLQKTCALRCFELRPSSHLRPSSNMRPPFTIITSTGFPGARRLARNKTESRQ